MTKDYVIKFFLLSLPIILSFPLLSFAEGTEVAPPITEVAPAPRVEVVTDIDPLPVFVAPPPLISSPPKAIQLSNSVQGYDLKGLFVGEARMFTKPSALMGTSEFRIPFANIEAEILLESRSKLHFELAYRSPASTGDELQVRQANYQGFLGTDQNVTFTAGLFESASLMGHKRFWRFDKSSRDLDWLAQRWGYTAVDDYGAELRFGAENMKLGVAVVNGEGLQKSEAGPQKDFSVWLAQTWTHENRETHFLISALRGGYENVPGLDSAKERYGISFLTSAESGAFFGVEGLWTRDPADAITLKVADLADLTDKAGQRVSGRLSAVTYGYTGERGDGGQRWEFFIRQDRVEPISGDDERGLISSQLGLVYSSQPGVDWMLHLSDIDYGLQHSLSPRDQQVWRLSFNVNWD